MGWYGWGKVFQNCRHLRTNEKKKMKFLFTNKLQFDPLDLISDIRILKRPQMETVDKLRSGLIDKILTIENKDILEALDDLISSSSSNKDNIELIKEQQEMLEMSEDDIQNGKLISQEAMIKRNLEWLNEL